MKLLERERARALRAEGWTLGHSLLVGSDRSASNTIPYAVSRRHPMGVASVTYSCSRTHRQVMGLVAALLSSEAIPG
jgi:hypothetical protein